MPNYWRALLSSVWEIITSFRMFAPKSTDADFESFDADLSLFSSLLGFFYTHYADWF